MPLFAEAVSFAKMRRLLVHSGNFKLKISPQIWCKACLFLHNLIGRSWNNFTDNYVNKPEKVHQYLENTTQ